MRPIALQTVLWKWIATTILVVVEDALQVAIPPAQKGFLKHRQMLHHVINARGLWESTEEGTFLSVDFAKAYDNVSHAFFEAGMLYLGLRDDITRLLVQSLSGEVQFCIDNVVAPNVSMTPQSGIRQGDPLSPPIFAVLTVFLSYHFKDQCPGAVLMLYADDLLIWIPGGDAAVERQAQSSMRVLQEFGAFSGLKVNMGKSFSSSEATVGPSPREICGTDSQRQCAVFGCADRARQCRAGMCGTDGKNEGESSLLKDPSTGAPGKSRNIPNMDPTGGTTNSKNLRAFTKGAVCIERDLQNGTGTIFGGLEPRNGGRADKPWWSGNFPLAVWVRYQLGQLYQTILTDKLQFIGPWVEGFESWAKDVGLSLNPQFFPYLQLAVVRLRPRTWIQASCQVFSRLRQKAPAPPLVGPPDKMPLWHNVLFRNSKGHTYYSPKLVRKGVTKLAEVMEGGGLKASVSFPPTWQAIYQSAIPFVSSLPIQDLPIA